jgi:hypothetical protein
MNWLSCEVPKNSFSAATTGRMLISVCGVIASTSWVVIRSRTTRSIRSQAGAELVLDQLADRTHAPVAEVVDVVGLDRRRLPCGDGSSVSPACSATM